MATTATATMSKTPSKSGIDQAPGPPLYSNLYVTTISVDWQVPRAAARNAPPDNSARRWVSGCLANERNEPSPHADAIRHYAVNIELPSVCPALIEI
jgi:hypothetical protein